MQTDRSKYVAPGFQASAIDAGLKQDGDLDLALIFSKTESVAAGVFTTNKVKAAPVLLSRERIRSGTARAIIANAGNANACTGKAGLEYARLTVDTVAREMGIAAEQVLVASTGIIGRPLNVGLITASVPLLVRSLEPKGIALAARALMTTDSFPKLSIFDAQAGGCDYRILGLAKGAGMIMPNMATMLGFLLTDISIDRQRLQTALASAVEDSFNRITVDGETSTNDTVIAMANGRAGNRELNAKEYKRFARGLLRVCRDLARMIVRDGEGATKEIKIEVRKAASSEDALRAARTVANSSLVKTAFYGQDPNWGRIMAALGRADITMDEAKVDIDLGDIRIVAGGLGQGAEAEKKAAEIMARHKYTLKINLHKGRYRESVTTCDLTHDYVSINAHYRS